MTDVYKAEDMVHGFLMFADVALGSLGRSIMITSLGLLTSLVFLVAFTLACLVAFLHHGVGTSSILLGCLGLSSVLLAWYAATHVLGARCCSSGKRVEAPTPDPGNLWALRSDTEIQRGIRS